MTQDSIRNSNSHITDGLCAFELTSEPQFSYLKSTCLCVYVCMCICVYVRTLKVPLVLTFCASKLVVLLRGCTSESPGGTLKNTDAGEQPPEVLIQSVQGSVCASVLLGSSPVTPTCSQGRELLPWEGSGRCGTARHGSGPACLAMWSLTVEQEEKIGCYRDSFKYSAAMACWADGNLGFSRRYNCRA